MTQLSLFDVARAPMIERPCGGYKVGPKWGRFAESRDDALSFAISEARERIGTSPDFRDHLKWLDGLT